MLEHLIFVEQGGFCWQRMIGREDLPSFIWETDGRLKMKLNWVTLGWESFQWLDWLAFSDGSPFKRWAIHMVHFNHQKFRTLCQCPDWIDPHIWRNEWVSIQVFTNRHYHNQCSPLYACLNSSSERRGPEPCFELMWLEETFPRPWCSPGEVSTLVGQDSE